MFSTIVENINRREKHGNKKTINKTPMHPVQKSKLFRQQTKTTNRKKIGIEKILQVVQKAHGAQRRKKVNNKI